MSIPLPTSFLRGLSDVERKKALEMWKELNETASKNPKAYREKISSIMKEAAEVSEEPSKSFIHYKYTLKAVLDPCTDLIVQILTSSGIKEMVGTDVPLLISRERVKEQVSRTLKIYDLITHPTVLEKEHQDASFASELQTLFLKAVCEENQYSFDRIREVTRTSEYMGPWLWTKEGRQKSVAELTEFKEFTPQLLLEKVHDHQSEQSSLHKTESMPVIKLKPNDAPLRSDSKLLIEELHESPSFSSLTLLSNSFSRAPSATRNLNTTEKSPLYHQLVDYLSSSKKEYKACFHLPFLSKTTAFAFRPELFPSQSILILSPSIEPESNLSSSSPTIPTAMTTIPPPTTTATTTTTTSASSSLSSSLSCSHPSTTSSFRDMFYLYFRFDLDQAELLVFEQPWSLFSRSYSSNASSCSSSLVSSECVMSPHLSRCWKREPNMKLMYPKKVQLQYSKKSQRLALTLQC